MEDNTDHDNCKQHWQFLLHGRQQDTDYMPETKCVLYNPVHTIIRYPFHYFECSTRWLHQPGPQGAGVAHQD